METTCPASSCSESGGGVILLLATSDAHAGFIACASGNNPTNSTAPNTNGTNDFCTYDAVNDRLTCDLAAVCASSSSGNDAYVTAYGNHMVAWAICDNGGTNTPYCAVFDDASDPVAEVYLAGTDQADFLSFDHSSGDLAKGSNASIEAFIIAWAGDDTLVGSDSTSDYTETLQGNGGHDHLSGRAGKDTLDGGDGDDFCWGGSASDTITGGAGADFAAGGSNTILPNPLRDVLTGNGGDDVLCGEDPDNVLANLWNPYSGTRPNYTGGQGPQWSTWTTAPTCKHTSGASPDHLDGGGGDDRLYPGGSTGDDLATQRNWVSGGVGYDQIFVGPDTDEVCDPGGDNDDVLPHDPSDPGHGHDVWIQGTQNVGLWTTVVGNGYDDCTDHAQVDLSGSNCTPVANFACTF